MRRLMESPGIRSDDRRSMITVTPEMIAAAWQAWHSRHGGKLGPGPAFVEAITAALGVAHSPSPVSDKKVSDIADPLMSEKPPVSAAPPREPQTADPHPDDAAVDRFAAAMKAKLAEKRGEGFGGWNDPSRCPIDYLATLLVEQIQRRPVLDPVDIGNFAMMIFNRPGEVIDRGR